MKASQHWDPPLSPPDGGWGRGWTSSEAPLCKTCQADCSNKDRMGCDIVDLWKLHCHVKVPWRNCKKSLDVIPQIHPRMAKIWENQQEYSSQRPQTTKPRLWGHCSQCTKKAFDRTPKQESDKLFPLPREALVSQKLAKESSMTFFAQIFDTQILTPPTPQPQ